jgi:hypothetical protein
VWVRQLLASQSSNELLDLLFLIPSAAVKACSTIIAWSISSCAMSRSNHDSTICSCPQSTTACEIGTA